MLKRISILGLLLLTVACGVTSNSNTISTPVITEQFHSASTKVVPYATSLSLLDNPTGTLVPLSYTIKKNCPEQRDVPLVNLGLSLEDRLVVVPFNDSLNISKNGLSTIGITDSNIQPIKNTSPKDNEFNVFSGIEVSPDGKWVIYQRGSKRDEQLKLWISSIDGQQQWELGTINKGNLVNWVSNQTLVVFNYENLEPITSIDPFLNKIRVLDTMSGENTEGLKYFSQDDNNYNIYFGGEFDNSSSNFLPNFVLHNYSTHTDINIFPWMATQELTGGVPNANTIHSIWDFWLTKDGFFTIVVQKPYGFDLGNNLSLSASAESKVYNEIMKPVTLPVGWPNLGIIWAFRSSNAFAFERYDREKFEPQKRPFYIFDYDQMALKDYCLDRGHTLLWGSYASPDERFLAWTIYDLDGGYSNSKEVVILNLETGQVAHIPQVKLIGWGKITP